MTRPTRALQSIALATIFAAATLAAPVPSWAHDSEPHTTALHPGQSVQAAIDAAAPGTTIILHHGTYQGNLTITKTVTLRGDGHVVIEPAASVTHNACTDDPSLPAHEITGICIGQIGPDEKIINTVHDVTLTGLEISGFSGEGVFAAGTTRLRVEHLEVDHNASYGIIVDLSDHITLQSNRVHDNANGGVHLSSDDTVTATDNNTYANNGEGILFIDSSHGQLNNNQIAGNCVGLIVLDTGFPGIANEVRITANTIQGNDRYCPGDPGPGGRPAQGGLGLALGGTTNTIVADNRITDNILTTIPTGAEPPLAQGGVALIDSTPFGGRAPANNRIVSNTIRRNTPLDVVTDASGSHNVFDDNNCATATTADICN